MKVFLLDSFWSPATNKRNDLFGGSLDNRISFSMKVINAIKSEFSGKIVKICFNDGDEIFDDDELFIISK